MPNVKFVFYMYTDNDDVSHQYKIEGLTLVDFIFCVVNVCPEP